MKSRKKRNDLLGKLVFLIPLIVIVSVVVYGFFQVTAPGTITVEALAQDKYIAAPSEPVTLQASVTVGSQSGTTPVSFSESVGSYQVSFSSLQWYVAPASQTVAVNSKVTVYAVGDYDVIPVFIQVTTDGGFNATGVTVEHGVTPVIWRNPSNTSVTFSIGTTTEVIQAGQNMTSVYPTAGSIEYVIATGPGPNSSGTIHVE